MDHQKGLSLVELMIAITLGLILMAGVVQLFVSSKESFRIQQSTSGVQETGRLATEFINRDLRMGGFTGFRGRMSSITNMVTPVSYKNDYVNGISVLNASDVADLSPLSGTRALVIRGVLEGASSELIKNAENEKLTVRLSSTENGACSNNSTRLNGICVGDTLMIADYQKTIVFKATKLTVNGTSLEIGYAGTWGGDYLNYEQYFMPGARVSVARTVIYFIRNGASGNPSLYQKIGDQNAVELLEGVSNIAVKFNRLKTVSSYSNAAGNMDGLWNNMQNPVVSVQIELLLEGANNVLDEKQVYEFNGSQVTATDRKFRKVFSNTVALRNQLP